MGCCNNSHQLGGQDLQSSVKDSIQTGNQSKLRALFHSVKKEDKEFDINTLRIKVDHNFEITALGYALMLGQKEIFNFLYQELGCDFDLMERLFKQEETSGLSIICMNNYIGLLQSYLPIFITKLRDQTADISNLKSALVLNKQMKINDKIISSYTPIQLACENGHISIINFLIEYTAEFESVPLEIDVNYIDQLTGNNCALIACKKNNFKMIRFLHSQCKADFFIRNSSNENAVNVLCAGSKKNPLETLKCLEYLIEKIGIDPLHNYSHCFALLEETKSISYLASKLEELGVRITKEEIVGFSEDWLAKRNFYPEIDSKSRFTFDRLFPDMSKESMVSNGSCA